MSLSSKQFHVWTIGCQMNTADSHHVADALRDIGYTATPQLQEADVVVVNTCVVRQSAEDKALGKLGALQQWKKQKPGRTVALMGCMVGVNPSPTLTRRFPHVDVFMPPSESVPLINHLQQDHINPTVQALEESVTHQRFKIQDAATTAHDTTGVVPRDVTAFVPVVYGCSHACTFCIIPYRRGVERSRPLTQIREEVAHRIAQGAREVTLLGQIVDRYGYDELGPLGHSDQVPVHEGQAQTGVPDLADLLHAIHDIPELWRIRFLTSHPLYMSDRILRAVRDLPKVCEYIEVPVQAGNDKVLERMRRGYTNREYRDLIAHIRTVIPDCSINTDIIVGFCGETDEQFEDTFTLLQDLKLDKAHLARYSPRPGTVSERRMPDDVPEAKKRERHRRLETLMQEICLEHNQRLLGSVQEILIERQHKGKWMGRNRQNKLVFIDAEQDLAGSMILAQINWAGPWSMQGRLARRLDGPLP